MVKSGYLICVLVSCNPLKTGWVTNVYQIKHFRFSETPHLVSEGKNDGYVERQPRLLLKYSGESVLLWAYSCDWHHELFKI